MIYASSTAPDPTLAAPRRFSKGDREARILYGKGFASEAEAEKEFWVGSAGASAIALISLVEACGVLVGSASMEHMG